MMPRFCIIPYCIGTLHLSSILFHNAVFTKETEGNTEKKEKKNLPFPHPPSNNQTISGNYYGIGMLNDNHLTQTKRLAQ